MAVITILKLAAQGHFTSADEANDQIAISGVERSTAGVATLYVDSFTTSITIGSAGIPVTIPAMVTDDCQHVLANRVFS